jgi:hypothetical protein
MARGADRGEAVAALRGGAGEAAQAAVRGRRVRRVLALRVGVMGADDDAGRGVVATSARTTGIDRVRMPTGRHSFATVNSPA